MAPSRAGTKRQHTIRQCLTDLDITDATIFASCESRDDEFRVVKKLYFKQCRTHHPDKGGTAEMFRQINTSFELLRDLHNGTQQRRIHHGDWLFSDSLGGTNASTPGATGKTKKSQSKQQEQEESFDMSQYDFDFSNQEMPSWDYYEAAAEEELPGYRVELAKSGRSKCKATGKYKKCSVPRADDTNESSTTTELVDSSAPPEVIAQGEIRVGWLNGQTGTYGGWKHLRCWRVPNKVWLGLPDPDKCHDPQKFAAALETMNDYLLVGFTELSPANQQVFIAHCRDRSNWTAFRKPKKQALTSEPANTASTAIADTGCDLPGETAAAPLATINTALVVGRQQFQVPQPGVNGASAATVFAGKRFVLTGIFPEIGGGLGLTLGKDRVKQMIEAFGGRVTGSISGKTDVLVVGKDPGFSKVSQARGRDSIHMASLKDLKEGLDGGAAALEDFSFCNREEPMKIQSFSAGYQLATGYNGLALEASKEEMAAAKGFSSKKKAATTKAPPTTAKVIEIEDEKKPAAKPSSSSSRQKRKALETVPANKKTKKTTKSKPKGKSRKKAEPEHEDEELEDVIACDSCGVECTEESWFLATTEEDFCPHCHKEKGIEGAVLLRQGNAALE